MPTASVRSTGCTRGSIRWPNWRAGGGLSNGEQLPSLEDFLGEVMKEGCPTRLWLDIKNITYPSTLTEYAINAARRSCEIATEMGAKHFVEFICTGNTTVMKSAFAYAGAAGIPIGWMSNRPAGEYVGLGYSWANLSAASYMSAEAGGKGTRTLEEFEKEGVALSVFNVDRQAATATPSIRPKRSTTTARRPGVSRRSARTIPHG